MKKREAIAKIEWAIRAFEQIARDCEEIMALGVVGQAEARAWQSIAASARRNMKILQQ